VRRLHLGLRTLLGGKPGGFFLPYRHAAATEPLRYGALKPLFDAARPSMADILGRIEANAQRLLALDGPPPVPRWSQSWFSGLDGAALYGIVRSERPRRILEIGSGHSTRFLAQAVADGGFACAITCIDPQPRADLGCLRLELHRRLLEPNDAHLAAELAAGDILFVDSSHIAMPGSDVDLVLNEFLPRLAPGVLVHFHDIFLPDPYPEHWTWRGYNEQIAVACLLQGGHWALRFASHYLRQHHPEMPTSGVIGRLPVPPDALESSFWLEKLPEATRAGDSQSP
jgi:predicted O-methyltransferase YrrM